MAFWSEYKKAYHHLMSQQGSTCLFFDTRPFQSVVAPLCDVLPHIAGRAVTQAIDHNLTTFGEEGEEIFV